MKRSIICGGLLLAITQPVEATPKPSIVAVMTINDRTRVLSASVVEALTDALRGKLAESGRFVVIDKSRQAAALHKLVREQKRASYKACVDSACQIPLGQALAADKILRTKLTRIGSSYHLAAELVDLAKEAVVGAAQRAVRALPTRTRDDRLLAAISVIAYRLVDGFARRRSTAPRYGVPSGHARAGSERVTPLVTVEQLRERRAAAARRALQQSSASRADSDARRLRGSRFRKLFYGWSLIVTAGTSAGLGIYWMTAKVSAEADAADSATSASEIDAAADAASSARNTGVVFLVAGAISAGVGAYMLLTVPAVPEQQPTTGVQLDRMPTGAPLSDGFALSWGGRF